MDTWRMTLKRLIEERKRGSMMAKIAMSRSRKMSGAKRARKEKASKARSFSLRVASAIYLSTTLMLPCLRSKSSGP